MKETEFKYIDEEQFEDPTLGELAQLEIAYQTKRIADVLESRGEGK